MADRLAALAARRRRAARAARQDDRRRGDAHLPRAGALLDVALELVDAADAEGEDFPQLRVGVATGPALAAPATGTGAR